MGNGSGGSDEGGEIRGHVFVEIGLFRLTAAMGRVEEIVPWKSLVSLSEGLSV